MSHFLPAFVAAYSDSSFTNPHEVARPEEPRDCTGEFTHLGAKFWGFETARHQATRLNAAKDGYRFDHDAHHWIRLNLKAPAVVSEVCVSTRYFTGNQVPAISLTLYAGGKATEVLERVPLAPDQEHRFALPPTPADSCLVRCYHEGGIARINLFGKTKPESEVPVNLLDGARISHISNQHYGKPKDAVTGNRQVDYMLGWESARTGFGEMALFHLAAPARIKQIIVDTYLHRLNAPLACHIYGLNEPDPAQLERQMALRPRYTLFFDDVGADGDGSQTPDDFHDYMTQARYLEAGTKQFTIKLCPNPQGAWMPLLSMAPLAPDAWHSFTDLESSQTITHLLYMHYPNGGIHGLKVYGEGG